MIESHLRTITGQRVGIAIFPYYLSDRNFEDDCPEFSDNANEAVVYSRMQAKKTSREIAQDFGIRLEVKKA